MKYRVGDKVRIVNHRNSWWNWEGRMDKWMGKIMTIRKVTSIFYEMEEDKMENNGTGWGWKDDDFTELIPNRVSNDKIVIMHDGKTTTATLYREDGSKEKATAKCSPEDTFDFNVGAKLAMERLMEKVAPVEPPKPKYYNGKVVCVKSGYPWWTVGKVYEVVDGYIKCNEGCKYPNAGGTPYIDAEDVRHAGHGDNDTRHNPLNEFIELVM